jgi:hypothetical protein
MHNWPICAPNSLPGNHLRPVHTLRSARERIRLETPGSVDRDHLHEYAEPSMSMRSANTLSCRSGRRRAVGSARSSPGSARHGTATSATRSPPISTAALRASPKPGCRSCSVRRNAGRTPSPRSVGGLRPIRARTRSLRTCFRWSGPYTATLSGAARAGSNPAGGTSHMHKFERSDDLDATEAQAPELRRPGLCRSVRAECGQPEEGVRHHERAEDLHTGGAGRRAVL